MRYHSYKGIISYIYRIEKPGGYVPLTLNLYSIIEFRMTVLYIMNEYLLVIQLDCILERTMILLKGKQANIRFGGITI